MEDTKSEKLSTVFDGLIQDYESLHSSLNEIYNESQNIEFFRLTLQLKRQEPEQSEKDSA